MPAVIGTAAAGIGTAVAGASASTIAAGIGAAGAIGGALINSSAAGGAASSASGQSYAQLLENQRLQNVNTVNYSPYLIAGEKAADNSIALSQSNGNVLNQYQNALNPGGITEATLENTPGYKFNLQQGLQSTQNAAAARGLGVSGAALKGAATYATGLADSTYQNQYNDALNSYNSVGNQLNTLFNQNQGIAQLGASTAANQANGNLGFAAQAGGLVTGAANANTAATVAGANALTSGINGVSNAANNYSNNQLLQGYLNSSGSQYTPSSTQLPQSDNSSSGLSDYSGVNLGFGGRI